MSPNLKPLAYTLLLMAGCASAGPLVELSAEASRPAPNDLFRATVFAEATGTTGAEAARQVNAQIAAGLATAKGQSAIKVQTGSSHTWANYGKGGKIDGWRMRSELQLESRDQAALSDLLGRLQASLGVASLGAQPAPETRKQVEEGAVRDAIAAFQERAKVIAGALGKPYCIKQLNVSSGDRMPMPMFKVAAAPMARDASPMPVEGGESAVSVTVSGQIELAD